MCRRVKIRIYRDFIFYLVCANARRGIDVEDRAFSDGRTTSFNAERVNVIGKDSRFGRLTRSLLLKFLALSTLSRWFALVEDTRVLIEIEEIGREPVTRVHRFLVISFDLDDGNAPWFR